MLNRLKALIFVCRRSFFGMDRRFGPEMERFSGPFCFYEAGEKRMEVVVFHGYRNDGCLLNKIHSSEGKKMTMSRPASINVFSVALVSGALHGGAAMLFVPIFSFLLLCWSTTPAQLTPSSRVDDGMVLAVIAPALCAAFGFVVGALGAIAHNALAQNQRQQTVEVSEPAQVRTASLSNVA